MRASKTHKGMTLLELIMVGGVMGLFLTMVSHTVVLAYRTQAITSKETEKYRRAVIGVEWVGRELRMCKYLYSPAGTTFMSGTPYKPELGVAAPFVFRRYNSLTNADIVVGYTYDPASEKVIRTLYDPAFDPANSASQNVLESRTLAEDAENLEMTWIDPATTHGVQMVRARLQLAGVEPAPEMEVRVKKL